MNGSAANPALVLEAAAASADKKAEDIVILDVGKRLVITDYFLICSGNTERQVKTISDAVERRLLEKKGKKPARREGHGEARWVVLDYIDFVAHVFHREAREYYELERLWSDSPAVPFEEEKRRDRHEPAAAEAT